MPESCRLKRLVWIVGGVFSLYALSGAWGCGLTAGGDGGDNGEVETGSGSGDLSQDMLASLDTVGTVVSTSLNVGSPSAASLLLERTTGLPPPKALSQHVHCASGGPASVTGDIDGDADRGTFDLTVSLDGCEGANGAISVSGTYNTSGELRDFETSLSGSIGGSGCLLTMDALAFIFTVETSEIAAPVAVTFDGTLSGVCTEPSGDASLTCDWSGGIDADNPSTLFGNCSCSGASCE